MNSRAWSSVYGDGTTVQRGISGSWQAAVRAGTSSQAQGRRTISSSESAGSGRGMAGTRQPYATPGEDRSEPPPRERLVERALRSQRRAVQGQVGRFERQP